MQRISVTVSLNRSTLQFDEAAFERLERYLAEAASLLEGDPDPQEILSDLEQAVVDQCTRRLPADRAIVTLAELIPALDEIGSVQVPGATGSAAGATGGAGTESRIGDGGPGMQQVSEGAMISGVCQGLAQYFRLDVTLLRVFAVLLLLLSGGGMIVVYLALMLLLPFAPLAHGAPPIRWLPAKSRELVEVLRAKLHLATS